MKKNTWYPTVTGCLFIVAGLRDAFFPGFLSISSHPTNNVIINLTLGMIFLASAWVAHPHFRNQAGVQRPNAGKDGIK